MKEKREKASEKVEALEKERAELEKKLALMAEAHAEEVKGLRQECEAARTARQGTL